VIIDPPWRTTAKLAGLKASGVHSIIRYYNHRNSSTLPEKCLTLDEAQAINEAGLAIAVVFQQRQNRLSDFTASKGKADGEKALERAVDEIGQPNGSGIFFAVDFDVNKEKEINAVKDYFTSIRDVFAEAESSYRIGAYGGGHILNALGDAGLIDLSWLTMSRGWRGSREYYASKRWNLSQTRESVVAGLDVDLNEENTNHPDFGQFRLGGASSVSVGAHRPYVVNARSGLWLRAGPGTDFEKQRLLSFGQVVHVLGFDGEWARVDLEGDGRVDGHSHGAFLQRN